MRVHSIRNIFTGLLILFIPVMVLGQENILTHYFSANTLYNPALAGDTRFLQTQLTERVQPTVSGVPVNNLLLSVDYKIQNHHSGIGVHINQRNSVFSETEIKTNYSHTLVLLRKIWIKGGLGISLNTVNTHAGTYKFPDQYDRFGYTGNLTQEPSLSEKAIYAGLSSGLAFYYEQGWFSMAINNINRPLVQFAGSEYRTPALFLADLGYLFPIDKGKKAKRMFTRYGAIEPYSSLGPVVQFYKNGKFQTISFGINAFTRPVFWGIQYRYNSINNNLFSDGAASINFMAGYRNEILSFGYSYDFMINHTPTNYKGAHEISFVYYFYAVKEDYKKYKLFPYPNQLMY